MAYLGAVFIEYYREFMETDTSGNAPYLLDQSDDVIKIEDCAFTGNTAFAE